MYKTENLSTFPSVEHFKRGLFSLFPPGCLLSRTAGLLLILLTFMAFSMNAGAQVLTMQQPTNNEGTLNPQGQTTYAGNPLNIAISNVDPNYIFVTWTADPSGNAIFGSATSSATSITLTGDVTVSATFTQASTLTMAMNPAGIPAPGIVTPTTGSYTVPSGTPQAITAQAVAGYFFNNWTADSGNATFGDPNNPSTTVTLKGDATVTANFEEGCFLTTQALPFSSWGTVSPSGSSIAEPLNTKIPITATPSTSGRNCSFAGWTQDASNATFDDPMAASTNVTLTGNATIYANFNATYTLSLENINGLPSSRYTVYVLGFSTSSQKMLTVDSNQVGSFISMPSTTGNIPSYKLNDEITSITVSNTNPLDGVRIYLFVADNTVTYQDNPGLNGGPQFSYIDNGSKVTQCKNPPQTEYPIFNYIELTFLAGQDMYMDVSSVDGFFYPVTITALDAGGNAISQVGQPLPSSITGDKVVQVYQPFMATLTANGEDASPYNIMQQNPNPVPGSTAMGLINPGLYLQQNTPESMNNSLHSVFDDALTTIFTNSTFISNMSIWQNGTGTYSDFFTVTAVTAPYPFPAGNTNTHSALTFTGNTSGSTFTVFNPVGFSVVNYQGTDNNYYQITGTIQDGELTFDNLSNPMPADTPLAVGMYVNSSGGTTDGTTQIIAITNDPTGNYIASVTLSGSTNSSTSCPYMFAKAPTNFYFSSGCMVFAGLGLMADGGIRLDTTDPNVQTVTNGLENQIATALNRGVGVLDSGTDDGHTTDYWATETNWYPTLQPQNFFSLFMHTAQVGNENIFKLPPNPVAAARGGLMAMSYGFCYDENPMHSIPGPQVPSEFPVPFPENTASLKLTLGPWYTSSLTMAANLEEGGTISPEKGSHDHHYVSTVPLAANIADGYQFGRWNVSGNCMLDNPGTPEATLTLTGASATATANFAKIQDISSISAGGKISVSGLADSQRGTKRLFVFNVTDENNFTLTTSGGVGDCDLYVKHGMAPNLADYQYKSTLKGNAEILVVNNPAAGDWYVLLYPAADFADVKLDIEVNAAVPKKPILFSSISGTKVNLSWTTAPGETYDIYRSETNSTSSAKVINSTAAFSPSVLAGHQESKEVQSTLSHQEAFTGTYYYYWVKAKKNDPVNPGKYLESDFSDVSHPNGPDVIIKTLSNGVPVTGMAGDASSSRMYQIDVPAGQALLEIKAYGGKGDYALDAGIDGNPEKYRALVDSPIEITRIENPEAGSYLIHLYGKTAYSGVSIVAKYYGAAPARVTGLTAGKGSFPDKIILGWKDSPGATFYEIWRSNTKLLEDAAKIWDASDNSYEDNTDLETDATYWYWIKAGNSAGVSKESASASGYLMKIPSAIPRGLKASNSHFDRIAVTWPKYTGASSYLLYRNTVNSSADAAILAEVASVNNISKYSYDNMGDDLATGTKYYYFVKARNGSGTSDFSLGAAGILNNKGPVSIDASKGAYFGKVRITWPAVAGATGYEVHRYTDKDLPQNEQVYDAGGNLFYEDAAAIKEMTYYYRVKAKYKSVYTSLFSPADSGYHNDNIASLSAPKIKSATKGDFSFVRITWTTVTLAGNYKVYRNTVNIFETSQLTATTANISYDDAAALPDTTYWYWIKANNDSAEATSVPSASLSGFAKSASTAIADGGSATTDGEKNSYKFYAADVPMETSRLLVTITGTSNTNNCELYVKLASYPSTSSFNAKGLNVPDGKTLTVTNPAEGTWYILLYGRTDYANVTLNVKCYSASDIIITEAPLNNCLPPFNLKFKGQVVDKSGKGIPGLNLQARDPITGTTTWLDAKTNSGGFWTFTGKIEREGAHAFDFFFSSLPDLAKGTATHTVFTMKDCWKPDGSFDFSSYMTGMPSELNLAETIGLQDYLNIRKGWETGAIDTDSEEIWIAGTLGKAPFDSAILNNMDDGLYMLFYAFDGTGCGNDLTADSALRPYPLLVHVLPGKLITVANNLVALGVLGEAQKTQLLAGKTGVVTVAALSNPGEDVSNDREVSLMAREQLEALANLAANNSSVSFVEDRKFGDVMAKVIKIKVDGDIHEFNAATECFIRP
jgi:hypothetical protein